MPHSVHGLQPTEESRSMEAVTEPLTQGGFSLELSQDQQDVVVAPGRFDQRELVPDPQRPPRHTAVDLHQSARAR